MRVDAHHHYWRIDRGDYGWLTPDLAPIYRDFLPADLAPLLGAAGVERTVLVQAAPTVAETELLLGLAAASDSVAGVVGWVDMEAADAPRVVADLAADPWLKGLRPMIQDIADPDWMLRPELAPAFAALVEADLVFDALVKPLHLANLMTLVERHPGMTLVIDHGAKPDIGHWRPGDRDFAAWAEGLAALADAPRVHCKLSGLVTEAAPGWRTDDLRPYAETLLEAFGPERLLWGSDWPVLLQAGDYEGWCRTTDELLVGLDAAERAAVLGGTAARCYRL